MRSAEQIMYSKCEIPVAEANEVKVSVLEGIITYRLIRVVTIVLQVDECTADTPCYE